MFGSFRSSPNPNGQKFSEVKAAAEAEEREARSAKTRENIIAALIDGTFDTAKGTLIDGNVASVAGPQYDRPGFENEVHQ